MSYIKDGKIEIMRNKGSTVKLLILSAVFVLMCIYMGLFMDLDEIHGRLGAMISTALGGFLFRAVMLAGAVIFAAAFVLILRQSKNGKPLFSADENGVTDYSTAASAGVTVPWRDIKRIYIDKVKNQGFIELELYDTESYLNRLPSVKQKAAKANLGIGHQAICITLIESGIKPEDVLPDLVRLWEKYNGISLLSE